MIYLIETTYYNKETKKVLDLLKIGYTEDSRKDIRFMAYKMHNPGFKLLYEIPNLSEDVEKRVQYKFRNLLYSEYGREWFYYSDDIINFFRDIDKIDLESLPKSPMSERRKYWKLNKLVKNVVYWVSVIPKESKRDYIEKIIEDLGSNLKNIQDILNYIEKDYGSESTLEYRKMIERKETKKYCNDDIINQEVSSVLYEFEQKTTYYDKMKLLCNTNLSKEALELILAQISEEDDNRLESLRSLGQFFMISVTKMDEVLKKSRENENPIRETIRKNIDNFMESIENLMKLQDGLKGYLMIHIDSIKPIKPEMQKIMNEFETKKLVKIPEGWDFLEVDDDYNVIVVREKKEA